MIGGRTEGRIRSQRRAWLGRAAIVALALAVVATVTAIGVHGRDRRAAASPLDVVQIHSAHGASFLPSLHSRRPIFILALGSDARPGQDIQHQRSDSIHLIGVNPALHRATVLGFPRDSWVPIPGFGTNKINTAMSDGGPNLMVSTIENITGIRIDYWLLTSFRGLTNMVNGIGGLTVQVTQSMHDRLSGSNFKPGIRHFNGKQALSFARDRHSFLNGDLTRSGNQGRLLVSALAQLHLSAGRDPGQLFSWLAVGWRNVSTDLSVPTLLDLALTALSVPTSRVRNLVVPATTGTAGGASVVFLAPGAQAVFADMRGDGALGR
jgi:LCP family protein required for cell wall assembly